MVKLVCFLLFFHAGRLTAQQAGRYDLIIHEIYADPSPSHGLPDCEYIEVRNRSARSVNLQNWILSDGFSLARIRETYLLQPDSLVVLCPAAYAAAFRSGQQVIGLNGFPSLNNSGDLVILIDPSGRTIHAVRYDSSWYGNPLKKEGGWSLEMADISHPCLDRENWKASSAPLGGTPGEANSSRASVTDLVPPVPVRTYTPDSATIIVVFNESLDSLSAADPASYVIDNGIGQPVKAEPLSPLFTSVRLSLPAPLSITRVYRLTVQGPGDCTGNRIEPGIDLPAGRPSPVSFSELVINEILFNPPAGGLDYIELYNRSGRVVDASGLYLGGLKGPPVPCSATPFLVFPGDHLTLTEDREIVQSQYSVKNPGLLLTLRDMPSFPDQEGLVYLMNDRGDTVDRVHYTDRYHFPLLAFTEGVALEKTNPEDPSGSPSGWHSASSDAGYGTPTYRNSQFRINDTAKGAWQVSPQTFSPDQDGHDDYLTIQYQFQGGGQVCTIIIFDQDGRPVRYVARNNLCGTSGFFRWNGLDEKNNRLQAGIYYLVAESFSLDGHRKRVRFPVILARRM
jgi:hypothetical protein